MTVKILKIGVSNIGSLANMLDYLDVEFDICINAKELKSASKIIMPGVGSFDAAMLSIKETGVDEELKEISAKFQTPILGICLGMQLLLGSSDEGLMSGLKLIDGQCKKFEPSSDFKVHICHGILLNRFQTRNYLRGSQTQDFILGTLILQFQRIEIMSY